MKAKTVGKEKGQDGKDEVVNNLGKCISDTLTFFSGDVEGNGRGYAPPGDWSCCVAVPLYHHVDLYRVL
jgi:hypothetical protein